MLNEKTSESDPSKSFNAVVSYSQRLTLSKRRHPYTQISTLAPVRR